MTTHKKMKAMMEDLKQIKYETLGDEKEMKEIKQLTNCKDDFERLKFQITEKLETVKEAIERMKLPDIDKKVAIGLKLQNTKILKEVGTQFMAMKDLIIKSERNKTEDEKTILRKKEMMNLLHIDIKNCVNHNVRSENISQVINAEERLQKRREVRKELREQRRQRKNGDGEKIGNFVVVSEQPRSQQVQEFIIDMDKKREEEDEMLTEIGKGMDELKELAISLRVGIDVLGSTIKEADTKMDNTQANLDRSNARLDELNAGDRGCSFSRMCPIIVCIIILISLLGYIIKMIG
jgi:hypothetical protein